jgi:hypothetical protein
MGSGASVQRKVFVMSRERRRLFQEEEPMAEPGRYGCPMLARARRFSPIQVNGPQWRCSLGWALRGELDVACCLATESATDCWKVHPERKPIVELSPPPPREHKASAD